MLQLHELGHRQLVQLGKDAEYGRELEAYLAKLPFPVAEAEELTPQAGARPATT